MNFMDTFNRAIRPLKQMVQAMVSRAVVRLVDDSMKMQLAQISLLADEVREGVEHFQPYGFTFVPKAGAEAVVVFPQGNREHGIIVQVSDRRYRLVGLAEGEVALYTDEGDKIHFQRGRKIHVETLTLEISAETKVEIISPLVTMSGQLEVAGNIMGGVNIEAVGNVIAGGNVVAAGGVTSTAAGTSLAAVKSTFNTHTHNENGTGGGVTNAPNTSI